MRGFWLECRRGLATPGLQLGLLGMGVTAGIDTHEGLPLDLVAVPLTAAYVTVIIVPMLVLLRRIPWIRRRLDVQAGWGGRPQDPSGDS